VCLGSHGRRASEHGSCRPPVLLGSAVIALSTVPSDTGILDQWVGLSPRGELRVLCRLSILTGLDDRLRPILATELPSAVRVHDSASSSRPKATSNSDKESRREGERRPSPPAASASAKASSAPRSGPVDRPVHSPPQRSRPPAETVTTSAGYAYPPFSSHPPTETVATSAGYAYPPYASRPPAETVTTSAGYAYPPYASRPPAETVTTSAGYAYPPFSSHPPTETVATSAGYPSVPYGTYIPHAGQSGWSPPSRMSTVYVSTAQGLTACVALPMGVDIEQAHVAASAAATYGVGIGVPVSVRLHDGVEMVVTLLPPPVSPPRGYLPYSAPLEATAVASPSRHHSSVGSMEDGGPSRVPSRHSGSQSDGVGSVHGSIGSGSGGHGDDVPPVDPYLPPRFAGGGVQRDRRAGSDSMAMMRVALERRLIASHADPTASLPPLGHPTVPIPLGPSSHDSHPPGLRSQHWRDASTAPDHASLHMGTDSQRVGLSPRLAALSLRDDQHPALNYHNGSLFPPLDSPGELLSIGQSAEVPHAEELHRSLAPPMSSGIWDTPAASSISSVLSAVSQPVPPMESLFSTSSVRQRSSTTPAQDPAARRWDLSMAPPSVSPGYAGGAGLLGTVAEEPSPTYAPRRHEDHSDRSVLDQHPWDHPPDPRRRSHTVNGPPPSRQAAHHPHHHHSHHHEY
jgi:hypothetical protein